MSEVAFKDLDSFPLVIKICASPGFNQTAIYELGYAGVWQYFRGKSRFDNNVFGWAGHTDQNASWATVPGTLEKIQINKVTDIIESVNIRLNTDPGAPVKWFFLQDEIFLERVNYPYNCYTLDLTNDSRLLGQGLRTMNLKFKTKKQFQAVHIQLYGKTLAAHRQIFDHTVFSTGDMIKARPGEHNKFALRIEENVFVEEDDTKNCRRYPNSEFATYRDCDDYFVRRICSKADLVPVWMVDQFENVTTFAALPGSGHVSIHQTIQREP